MNYYALALAAVGVSVAATAQSDGARAIGSILASVAGGVLLRPHIVAVGEPLPAPIINRIEGN